MALHNRDVNRVARRQKSAVLSNLTGSQYVCSLDSENVVNDIQDYLKRRPDSFSPVDRCVPMKGLLQHFRVCDQPLSSGNKPFQQHLRFCLVRMRGTDEVHRNVRVDEDQL